MNKLRVSYSLLNSWKAGRVDDCVNMYLHKEMPRTRQMQEGIEWDDKQMESATANGKLTKEFLDYPLVKPQTQLKLEIDYSEHFTLVTKLDIYDSPTVIELKTGKRSALSYLNSEQLDMYGLACKLKGLEVEKIMVIRYDQYNNKCDWAFKWMNETVEEKAHNFIQTYAGEVYDYFQKINIL